jgi:hypothetical protein
VNNIEDLPVFESKSKSRIRRGHDLWDSSHGEAYNKHNDCLIYGILKKHLGKPWAGALKELDAKVKGLRGERTHELIKWVIKFDTWMEDGKIMCYGLWGPEILRPCRYHNQEGFFVHPASQTVERIIAPHYAGPFIVPQSFPGVEPGEQFLRAGNVWYSVRFSKDQLKTIREGKVLKVDKCRDVSIENGSQLARAETRTLVVMHQTSHRGYPANWPWTEYVGIWKQTLDRNLGQSEDDVLIELCGMPAIYETRSLSQGRTPYDLNTLTARWVLNLTNPGKKPVPKWAPYRLNRARKLEVNPEKDRFEQRIDIRPVVQPLGGKALARVKAKIELMREASEAKKRKS